MQSLPQPPANLNTCRRSPCLAWQKLLSHARPSFDGYQLASPTKPPMGVQSCSTREQPPGRAPQRGALMHSKDRHTSCKASTLGQGPRTPCRQAHRDGDSVTPSRLVCAPATELHLEAPADNELLNVCESTASEYPPRPRVVAALQELAPPLHQLARTERQSMRSESAAPAIVAAAAAAALRVTRRPPCLSGHRPDELGHLRRRRVIRQHTPVSRA